MAHRLAASMFLILVAVAAPLMAEWTGPDPVEQAARRGDPTAQLEMGILYEYGFYMKDNEIPALAWYMLAANAGNEQAAMMRDRLMKKMSGTDIDKARALSKTLVTGAAAAPSSQPAPPLPAPQPEGAAGALPVQ